MTKKLTLLTKVVPALLLMGLSSNAFSGATYLAGISYTFSGEFGVTIKALSDDKESRTVASVGATYYPFAATPYGIDLGAGYTYNDAAATISWDFIQKSIQFSGGYADIEDDKKDVYTPPVTAPPSGSET